MNQSRVVAWLHFFFLSKRDTDHKTRQPVLGCVWETSLSILFEEDLGIFLLRPLGCWPYQSCNLSYIPLCALWLPLFFWNSIFSNSSPECSIFNVLNLQVITRWKNETEKSQYKVLCSPVVIASLKRRHMSCFGFVCEVWNFHFLFPKGTPTFFLIILFFLLKIYFSNENKLMWYSWNLCVCLRVRKK